MADTVAPDHETLAEKVESLLKRDREIRRLMKDLDAKTNDLNVVIANMEADLRILKDERNRYQLERQGIDNALLDLRYH